MSGAGEAQPEGAADIAGTEDGDVHSEFLVGNAETTVSSSGACPTMARRLIHHH
jgi:hypothetical protein